MKREKQMTFANTGFERYARQTKRAVFLEEMNAIVPVLIFTLRLAKTD